MNSITLTLTVNSPELAKQLIDLAAGARAASEAVHIPTPLNQTPPAFSQTQKPDIPTAPASTAAPYTPPAPVAAPYKPPASTAPVIPPQQPNAAPAPAIPTAPAPSYTIADLQNACAPLMDAGRMQELQALLKSFGVQALTLLPKESYGEFATALRALGAQI